MHNTHRNVCLTHIKLVAKGGQRKKLLFANTLSTKLEWLHSQKILKIFVGALGFKCDVSRDFLAETWCLKLKENQAKLFINDI